MQNVTYHMARSPLSAVSFLSVDGTGAVVGDVVPELDFFFLTTLKKFVMGFCS